VRLHIQDIAPESHETRDNSNKSCFTKSQVTEIPLNEMPTPVLNNSKQMYECNTVSRTQQMWGLFQTLTKQNTSRWSSYSCFKRNLASDDNLFQYLICNNTGVTTTMLLLTTKGAKYVAAIGGKCSLHVCRTHTCMKILWTK
jgi:hypothetical protein